MMMPNPHAADRGGGPDHATVRIVIVDDHPSVRMGVRMLLEADPVVQVVGEAGDGHDALTVVAAEHPTVVLIDINLPGCDGVALAQQIRSRWPSMVVLGFSAQAEPAIVHAFLATGASGYLLKEEPPERVRAAVRAVAAGARDWFSTPVQVIVEEMHALETARVVPRLDALTEREREVLALLVLGQSNAAIAATLHMSVGTLKHHLHNMKRKLHLASRGEMIAWAARLPPFGRKAASSG